MVLCETALVFLEFKYSYIGTSEPSRKRQSHFLSDHSDESDAESSILTPVDDQSCASTQKQASSKSSRRRFLDDSSSDED